MTEHDVNVVLINFPSSGKEMVIPNEDDTYTILINARLSHDEQLKAYRHAINHINNDDFEKQDVQAIEYQAHGLTVPVNAKKIPAANFEKMIRRLRREKKRIQKALAEKEREIEALTSLYGSDYVLAKGEYERLYQDV